MLHWKQPVLQDVFLALCVGLLQVSAGFLVLRVYNNKKKGSREVRGFPSLITSHRPALLLRVLFFLFLFYPIWLLSPLQPDHNHTHTHTHSHTLTHTHTHTHTLSVMRYLPVPQLCMCVCVWYRCETSCSLCCCCCCTPRRRKEEILPGGKLGRWPTSSSSYNCVVYRNYSHIHGCQIMSPGHTAVKVILRSESVVDRAEGAKIETCTLASRKPPLQHDKRIHGASPSKVFSFYPQTKQNKMLFHRP